MAFKIDQTFKPCGDQPQVIKSIVEGLTVAKHRYQMIKGATGTGKTFVMGKIIEAVQRPTLVLAHNKTLAAQLYREFTQFFPTNAVEYFVSYYDYYQPEAYVVKRDLYIEKDSSINDEVDRLRLKATAALIEREDVIIVASVSCIYGLGSPEHYKKMYVFLTEGTIIEREALLAQLVDIQYQRSDDVLKRGTFRVRGEVVDIYPAYEENIIYRIEFFGNEVEALSIVDALNQKKLEHRTKITIFPAKHFIMPEDRIKQACVRIEAELEERIAELDAMNKPLERERLRSRVLYDLEMLKAVGHCTGIENYSRHLAGRGPSSRPMTLIDYFPDNFLVLVDESHVTLPQVRGMYEGDRSRKTTLVDYGFRLPSALDNRPLMQREFLKICNQMIFVSATPGPFELEHSSNTPELINRPTGLLDPVIEVRPVEGQIDNLIMEIKARLRANERVLITTLTKKMAEELTTYLKEHRFKVGYMHSDVETIERVEIIKALRQGILEVLVGINLLREGLDLPEVSLVAILDADKIGFLRSQSALIQTIGRASRNINGKVLMYADKISIAMDGAIAETQRRRTIQTAFNKKHGVIPKTIIKSVEDIIVRKRQDDKNTDASKPAAFASQFAQANSTKDLKNLAREVDFKMRLAADKMEFEKAIQFRDQLALIQDKIKL
ncbi:UvrABC system protein B [Spirochaetota bacterium]|nr:UvrABC system protein B [Spirochaetota bacterium]